MKKYLALVLALIVCIVVIAGCGGDTTTKTTTTSSTTKTTTTTSATTTTQATATGPKYGGTLRIIQTSGPKSPGGWVWNLKANDSAAPQFIFEPLFRGTADGNLVPWLVETYEFASDYTYMTFHLRQGVKFHDGSDFNAEVAKWNLENAIAAKLSTYWTTVDIIDNYTIRLNVNKWSHVIVSGLMDATSTYMVSYEAFKAHDQDWVNMNPVGTGPFKFDSFQADAYYNVVRNDNYWQKDASGNALPYLDGINTMFVTDASTRLALAQSGEVETVSYEPGKTAKDYSDLGMKLTHTLNTGFAIKFDTANENSPFADQKVREAVAYAINNEEIAQGFSYGYWDALYQLAAPATPIFDSKYQGRKYDLDKAKQLMKDAGYENGFTCSMLISCQPINRDILVTVQNYLSKININLTLDYADSNAVFYSKIMAPLPAGTLVFEGLCGIPTVGGSASNLILNPYNGYYVSTAITPEYKTLYDAMAASPVEDPAQVAACVAYLQQYCIMTPVYPGGKGWAVQTYVMDSGWFTRSFLPWWTFEKTWFDK